MLNRLRIVLSFISCVVVAVVVAQTGRGVSAAPAYKLSSSLRALVRDAECGRDMGTRSIAGRAGRVCALVRTADATPDALVAGGCRVLDSVGDIFVADIPTSRLAHLAADSRICRIEAERGNEVQLDSMALYAHVADIRTGHGLPQAYDGSGVVVGIMDVGFDLAHPTFLDAYGHSRISRFWDQLSADTIGSSMYVGQEYATEQAITSYGRSRDGESIYHGTYTLGIAAGGGAGTSYVGMATGSELCLVSNAVSGDEPFIADADMYKYTTATDVLGFKYIFDYATSVGKPCVISFSEGAHQDLRGDDLLYHEALSRLVGPGRIIVASAGNEAVYLNYVAKPVGRESAGTFVRSDDERVALSVRSSGAVALRTIIYNVPSSASVQSGSSHVSHADGRVVLDVHSADVCASADSTLADTITIDGLVYVQRIQAYRSCYDASSMVLDVQLMGPDALGGESSGRPMSVEMVGGDEQAEAYLMHGVFCNNIVRPSLADADISHSILSPGCAPDVICVGSTSYRPQFVNWRGQQQRQVWGATGERSGFSSVGPTLDGRTKPDVMAPGANVISAMSSYFMAAHPEKLDWLVGTFDSSGRTYGWCADCGTSTSTPVVAGIIALWLQAAPSLSPQDVRGILQRTCRPCGDYGEQTSNYCGYGAIDGYAGLLDILGLTGIDGLSADNPRGVDISISGNVVGLRFDRPAAGLVDVCVYGLDGRKLVRRRLDGGQSRYAVVTDLPKGVYAVQLSVGNGGPRGSVLVRIG